MGRGRGAMLVVLSLSSCGRLDYDALPTQDGAQAPDGAGMIDAGPAPSGTILVPAGDFVMGSDSGEGEQDELPEHIVTLSAFYLDVTEVTNRQYRACVTAGVCTPPVLPSSSTRPEYWTNPAFDEYPVIHVDWTQAQVYCAWRDMRLPTEAEWEKAARGGCELVSPATCGAEDERTYPWGETLVDCTLANYRADPACVGTGDTDRVGARSPAGDGPYGHVDLCGNVSELVQDFYSADYTWCPAPCVDPTMPQEMIWVVVRGGHWNMIAFGTRAAQRDHAETVEPANTFGIRCAASP